MPAKERKELYQRIKIAGLLSFIPLILVTGGITGYLLGLALEKKFTFAWWALPVGAGIGLLAAVVEAVRIIKLSLRIDKKS